MNRILQLQQEKAAHLDAALAILGKAETEKRALTPEELSTVKAKQADAQAAADTLALLERQATLVGTAGSAAQVHNNNADRPFGYEARSGETAAQKRQRLACAFGDQLQAVVYAAKNPHKPDARLLALNERAASGASEAVPGDGGFLVAPDVAEEVMAIAHDTGQVYTRGRKLPLSELTNAIKIPGIDEQSRVDGSRWGGVQMFWQNEADATTAKKPKFRQVELVTKKLMGLFYATDEILTDARVLGTIVTQAFGEEIGFKLDDAAINGDGSGKPLGVMNAPALITVAKESGQLAASILTQNIVKMWARMYARSRKNAVWFINQDAEPQLDLLSLPVGTGGSSVVEGMGPAGGALYKPAGSNGNNNEFGLLKGRPVIVIEQCQTTGTAGDIILADMSQWVYVDKGDPQQATSMHVRFLTDEMTFRWTYRVDGQPIWHTALTPFKGSATLSPFIALANR